MTTRSIEVELNDLLSLISCAEDYGYTDDVLMDAFAGWLGRKLSDEEIDGYAATFLTPESRAQGYSEEDAEQVRDRLRRFRERYNVEAT